MEESKAPCGSNCEHGGVCVLNLGHKGLHDSRYCQWREEYSVPREQADAMMRKHGYPQELLDLENMLRTMVEKNLTKDKKQE